MSSLETTSSTGPTTPSSSSANANQQPQQQSDDAAAAAAGMIDSLGDALAGVSLGFHSTTPTAAAAATTTVAAVDERREPTSAGNPFGATPTSANGGWGGFSNPDSSRNSFARADSNGQQRENTARNINSNNPATTTSSTQEQPVTPDDIERKQSIDLFLSRSPSQMLGNDVFKLSTGNLPGLAIPEEHGTGATTNASPAANQQQQRRGGTSPSSNVTGGTSGTGSRSNSPYEGTGSVGRTIGAYHQTPSSYNNPSTPGTVPMVDNVTSPLLQTPYHNVGGGNAMGGFNSPYDNSPAMNRQTPQMVQGGAAAAAAAAAQQPQQQILYMAVPTPDGRGQVLQPVQIMQMPGKQFAYVLPGATDGMPPPAMQQGPGGQQPMMVMPTMMAQQQQQQGQMTSPSQIGIQGQTNDIMSGLMGGGGGGGGRNPLVQNKTAGLGGYANSPNDGNPYTPGLPGLGTDDYGSLQGQGGMGGDNQYLNQPTDPALASLYSTPQRPPLDALLGQIRRLSRDQVGCRLVQQALDEEGAMAATLILNEGLPFWGEAMVDPFGNYLFQKILEKITAEERVMLIKSVSTRLVNASLNLHGTRSVQKIVELCAMDEDNKAAAVASNESSDADAETAADVLTKALTPAAARLCIDSHGNHVIQRILLKLGHKHSKFVFDAVAESVGDVARHRHGCCVIQRCLDSPPGPSRSHLVCRIVDKSLELMQDAYGNYVVQYVLDVCSDEDVHAVCESVVGKVNLLAIQKFSSNVMEKCLERCTDRVKEHYLAELSDTERVRELMMDPFGNYVIQRALSVATHAQAVRLVESMRPHLVAQVPGTPNGQRNGGVRNTAGGRRIMAKICRRFPNFNLNGAGSAEELYSQNRRHHHNAHHNNPNASLNPAYGMAQMGPTPIQLLQQHPPQQHQQAQLYATNANPMDYNTNSLSINPLNMGGGFQMDQRQQYYDLGADAGFYQQQAPHFGPGAYQNGL